MANIKRANASGITKPGTAISDVPDAPTIGTATGGSGAATVTYTAAATGGTATTFTATSSPGSLTGTGASPITISGLTNGTSYTFTVTASNSTGTSPASSASNSVTPVSLGDMDPIAMYEVGSGGIASVEFTSIPNTYTHLQIRYMAATNRSNYNVDLPAMQVGNGSIDTGANYSVHNFGVRADSVLDSNAGADSSNMYFMYAASSALIANTFGVGIIDILDYKNTNKYKTFRGLTGCDLNGTPNSQGGALSLASANWRNTSAITNIKFTPVIGPNFTQYSNFALYGIKDA